MDVGKVQPMINIDSFVEFVMANAKKAYVHRKNRIVWMHLGATIVIRSSARMSASNISILK